VGEEPENHGEDHAQDEAGDDGEIESGVLAAMNDVTGKAAEAKRKFAAEVEETTSDDEKSAEEKERAAEVAEGIHRRSVWKQCRGLGE
jgi:hypothetical protein